MIRGYALPISAAPCIARRVCMCDRFIAHKLLSAWRLVAHTFSPSALQSWVWALQVICASAIKIISLWPGAQTAATCYGSPCQLPHASCRQLARLCQVCVHLCCWPCWQAPHHPHPDCKIVPQQRPSHSRACSLGQPSKACSLTCIDEVFELHHSALLPTLPLNLCFYACIFASCVLSSITHFCVLQDRCPLYKDLNLKLKGSVV